MHCPPPPTYLLLNRTHQHTTSGTMGCTSSSESKIAYRNGKPTFKGDEVVKGFEKDNGLLFRVVKKKKKEQTWAFYNDTTDYDMHVRVTFHPGCELKALGSTKLEEDDKGEVIATVVVRPGKTEMFIEGKLDGFRSKMDAFPAS